MTKPTHDERARREAIDHFGITDAEFEDNRKYIEGTTYYSIRLIKHAWADLVRNFKGGNRSD